MSVEFYTMKVAFMGNLLEYASIEKEIKELFKNKGMGVNITQEE